MLEEKFSKWLHWSERNDLQDIENPGIYAIAYSESNLSGVPFDWQKEIIYIGMTNAVAGLKGRLNAFDYTISGRRLSHGGADRVRYAFRKYPAFSKGAYVSVVRFPCDVQSITPDNLEIMGDVARFEYICWAEYMKRHGVLPKFNNKNTKKFSKNSK